MATFDFDNGYQTNTGKQSTKRRRIKTNRVYGAPCDCFDLGLTCPHTTKEKTTNIPDSIVLDSTDKRPDWQKHFVVERSQNTQRYKAG